VAVVDMGGGTTDIAVFIDDGLCHTVILDLGGNHLTNDIAMGLHAPFETAEELKLRHGSVLPERIAEDETVWATVFGDKAERSFSRRFICEILEARATEMLEIVYERLEEAGYHGRTPAGVVLTGGSSQLNGMADLGRRVLGMPVRIGVPSPSQLPITGLSSRLASPTYATTVGLLLWGLHEDARSVRRGFTADTHQGKAIFGRTADFLRSLLPG
jgi:cell division protein FtsA